MIMDRKSDARVGKGRAFYRSMGHVPKYLPGTTGVGSNLKNDRSPDPKPVHYSDVNCDKKLN